MKIEITQTGVFNSDGTEIAVGEIIEHDGDDLPSWLIGKAALAGSKVRVAITNPAQEPIAEDIDDITALRAEYLDLTGEEADKRWKETTLRDKIAEAKA